MYSLCGGSSTRVFTLVQDSDLCMVCSWSRGEHCVLPCADDVRMVMRNIHTGRLGRTCFAYVHVRFPQYNPQWRTACVRLDLQTTIG